MPLEVLVILVVAGVSLVIGAVHLTGGSKRAALGDENAIRNRFLVDFPDAEIGETAISDSKDSALLFDASRSPLGLVAVVGSKTITRHFARVRLIAAEETETGIRLGFSDTTLAKIDYRLADGAVRHRFAASLGELASQREN